MKIVADSNLSLVDQTFAHHGELSLCDGRSLSKEDVQDADALIVRSVTRVDRALLDKSAVRFVGTATIGTDHLDTAWLDQANIGWASAPGCNADAAAQYTLSMIMLACQRLSRNPQSQSVGIIGAGNVGSRLARMLRVLKIPVQINDPPLSAAGYKGLVSLRQALGHPIVSLHVPLTTKGQWPTWQMINKDRLALMPKGALLVNAARGDVVCEEHLGQWLATGQGHAALDTWPGEPAIGTGLLEASVVATPHVAGYSERGKQQGSRRVYEAFCHHFGLPMHAAGTPGEAATLSAPPAGNDSLAARILQACPVERDDAALRKIAALDIEQRARTFDRLRKHYPPRREFAEQRWKLAAKSGLESVLKDLGFCA